MGFQLMKTTYFRKNGFSSTYIQLLRERLVQLFCEKNSQILKLDKFRVKA